LSATHPIVVLGGTGYVAGELLRLLASHPRFSVGAVASGSRAGERVAGTFPHLGAVYPKLTFVGVDAALEAVADAAGVVSCLPHGHAAAILDRVLAGAPEGCAVVDLSADFRLPDQAQYEEVYGVAHGAPDRIPDFRCWLPDLPGDTPPGPIAHPGCFTTCVTLACAPLAAAGLVDGDFHVSAVTGSTGSGRSPTAGTHHPDRIGNLVAYKPLAHRHRIEMEGLLSAVGEGAPRVLFVPHSGPFARGIHATIHVRLRTASTGERLREAMAEYYSGSPLVEVVDAPPRLRAVAGTDRCLLSAASDGRDAVLFSVIDNLVKGAAGGAVRWLNRKHGLDPDTGLRLAGAGWA
jgi:N-acetyl-gamma-glutamyl-phosphate reductase